MKKTTIILASAVMVMALLAGSCGQTGVEGPAKILIVQSYDENHEFEQDELEGFVQVFDEKGLVKGEDYELEVHYMGTKGMSDGEMEKASEEALAKIDEFEPSIVITFDDNAQTLVTKHLIDREGISVIFGGVNNDPLTDHGIIDSWDDPGHNVTGTVQTENLTATIGLFHEILESNGRAPLTKMALIYDSGKTAVPIAATAKADAAGAGVEIVIDKKCETFDDWKAAILEANGSAEFIYISQYSNVVDTDGNKLEQEEVIAWTMENATIPILGVADYNVTDGALCSEAYTGIQNGQETAKKAIAVLNGVPAGSIKVERVLDGTRMVNGSTAEMLGLELKESVTVSCEIVE